VSYIAEKAQVEKSVGPFLARILQERGLLRTQVLYSSASDKPTKAQAIRGWMGYKRVFLPRAAAWTQDLVGELLRFPLGVHDDQVDALGLFGRHLEQLYGGRRPTEPEPPRGITMDDYDRMDRLRRAGIRSKVAYYAQG
jgi:hypothetical protein